MLYTESPDAGNAHRARHLNQLHGLIRAERATRVFFGAEIDDLQVDEVLDVFADVPSAEVSRDRFANGALLVDILVEAGVTRSKKEARRSIEGGGVYVNNRRVAEVDSRLEAEQAIGGELFVLRKGRKSYHVVRVV